MGASRHRTFKSYVAAFLSPQRSLILSFGSFILLGTVVLTLPWSTNTGSIDLLDALFTATSAVCVTGLIVVDTGGYFTPWGQGVILGLIQAGGLGIMTFSVFFHRLLGMDISLRDRVAVRDTFAYSPIRDIFYVVKIVVVYTITVEIIGTCLLFIGWLPSYPMGTALYLSFFHAISAFCNAGFSLFEESLIACRANLLINLTVISLIVLGGIGFIVLHELRRKVEIASPFSLHTRLVLATTVILIVAGALIFFLLEQNNTLAGLSLKNSVLISFFQSVTTRTAGFSTITTADLAKYALFFTMLLMFIGGASGSTAGGVKVNTFGVLLATIWSATRGREHAGAFGREFTIQQIYRALTVALLSLALLAVVVFLLTITEKFSFIDLLFETFSAFGTVGLSTGITPDLSLIGRLIITATMFVGRLGPLTLVLSLIQRQQPAAYRYPTDIVRTG